MKYSDYVKLRTTDDMKKVARHYAFIRNFIKRVVGAGKIAEKGLPESANPDTLVSQVEDDLFKIRVRIQDAIATLDKTDVKVTKFVKKKRRRP